MTYNVDPDVPDQLIGDSLCLRRVITNLVGNAIRLTASKGLHKSHTALSCRHLAMDDDNVTSKLSVSNTGIGIAKNKLNMIFDMFCQADGIRWYLSRFTISKRLVNLMQGHMVESEVGLDRDSSSRLLRKSVGRQWRSRLNRQPSIQRETDFSSTRNMILCYCEPEGDQGAQIASSDSPWCLRSRGQDLVSPHR